MIFFEIWMLLGIIPVACVLISVFISEEEYEITLRDIFGLFVLMFTGIISVFVVISALLKIHGDKVILKGNKKEKNHAKV